MQIVMSDLVRYDIVSSHDATVAIRAWRDICDSTIAVKILKNEEEKDYDDI